MVAPAVPVVELAVLRAAAPGAVPGWVRAAAPERAVVPAVAECVVARAAVRSAEPECAAVPVVRSQGPVRPVVLSAAGPKDPVAVVQRVEQAARMAVPVRRPESAVAARMVARPRETAGATATVYPTLTTL